MAFGLAVFASESQAQCVGNCGTDGADGVVTLSPTGNSSYQFISTASGLSGAGEISTVGGTNGSQFTSVNFSGTSGEALTFYFNYVTSDGAEFADYGWAELQAADNSHVAWLFTGRTAPIGNTSPGLGLPANNSTLIPPTSAIVAGGPFGPRSARPRANVSTRVAGTRVAIQSVFDLPSDGAYHVVFGVTNFLDTNFDTGLAFDGLAAGGTPIKPGVPEPTTWAMMLLGFAGLGVAGWRRAKSGRALSRA